MLIQKIRNGYRKMAGRMVPVEPVTTVATRRSAANAGDFGNDVRARRLRRQRRAQSLANGRMTGWVVRTW